MRSILVIARREIGQYFTSPIAYMVAFAIVLLTSFMFNSDLSQRAGTLPPDGAAVLGWFGFFTVFFAPLLTMRLLAEETREGTLELMLTFPVRDEDVVIGKFLGAWAYYSALLGITLIYQIILLDITGPEPYTTRPDLDVGPVISAYLGIWLFGGSALSIGLLFSALSENQVIAGFLSMAVLFILWLGDFAGQVIQNHEIAKIVREFSLQSHYSTSFLIGVIRFEDAVFFICLIAGTVFLTTRLVESRRWR